MKHLLPPTKAGGSNILTSQKEVSHGKRQPVHDCKK